MKKLIAYLTVICLVALATASVHAASASYTEDTTLTIDDNPERGYYYHLQPAEWCNGFLVTLRDGGGSINQPVRLFMYDLDPDSINLTDLATHLGCARTNGVKVIFRLRYCEGLNCNESRTAAQMVTDANNLKNTFLAYRDVILASHAGFIGGWGEWSSFAGATPVPNTAKILVRDAILAMQPPEQPVLFRHSWNLMQWYPTPLNATTAFSGSPQSRSGFYNDCFMTHSDDRFTYPGPQTGAVDPAVTSTATQQRSYTAAMTRYLGQGGETCTPSTGVARTRCGAPNYPSAGNDNANQPGGIMNEGPRYRLHNLHRAYEALYHNQWVTDGCYAEVNRKMGYRFQLDSLAHSDSAVRGTTTTIDVQAHNVGWARPYAPRLLFLQFNKSGGTNTIGTDAFICAFGPQLRALPEQAATHSALQSKCTVPAGIQTGTYNGAFVFKDLDLYRSLRASDAQHRQYNARPANATSGGQSWDSTNRWFNSGTSISIS